MILIESRVPSDILRTCRLIKKKAEAIITKKKQVILDGPGLMIETDGSAEQSLDKHRSVITAVNVWLEATTFDTDINTDLETLLVANGSKLNSLWRGYKRKHGQERESRAHLLNFIQMANRILSHQQKACKVGGHDADNSRARMAGLTMIRACKVNGWVISTCKISIVTNMKSGVHHHGPENLEGEDFDSFWEQGEWL